MIEDKSAEDASSFFCISWPNSFYGEAATQFRIEYITPTPTPIKSLKIERLVEDIIIDDAIDLKISGSMQSEAATRQVWPGSLPSEAQRSQEQ